jgi:hypothetical protein
VADERGEEPELARRERERLVADGRLGVDEVDGEHGVAVRAQRLIAAGRARPRAADLDLQAREQLGRAERLRDVVVGARLERADLLELVVVRADHHDRQVGQLADALEHLPAVEAGQPDVEDHDVGAPLVQRPQAVLAARGLRDARAGHLEDPAEQRPDRLVVVDDEHFGAIQAAHTHLLPQGAPSSDVSVRCCHWSARLHRSPPDSSPPGRNPPHMAPHRSHSGVNPPARRRSGREGPQELTAAFRRYVERVQAVAEPTPREDLEAALLLAEDIMGHRRAAAVDASLAEAYGANIRQLAKAVRQAGKGAVAHPALLARAIVLARTLERTGAGRRAGRDLRDRELTGAGTR